jgi:hypothetical protein
MSDIDHFNKKITKSLINKRYKYKKCKNYLYICHNNINSV